MEYDPRLAQLLKDPSSVFERPSHPWRRSLSPARDSPGSPRPKPTDEEVNDPDSLIEDFEPINDSDRFFGVKSESEKQPYFDLDALNKAFREARLQNPALKARDLLRAYLNDASMQKYLQLVGMILDLNTDETEFVLYPNPSRPSKNVPTPPAPPAPVVNPQKPAALGVGGFDIDLNSHAMRVALYFQQSIVKFAISLAGKLTNGPLDSILETGFEDIAALSRKAALNQQEQLNLLSISGSGGSTTTAPAFQVNNWQAAFSERELQVLEQLRAMTTALGDSHAAKSVYSYLNAQHDHQLQAYQKWLLLPINLSQVYFKPFVQQGIDDALSILEQKMTAPRNALFHILINSDARAPFAELVAVRIQQHQARRVNTGSTGVQLDNLNQAKASALYRLQNCTFEVSPIGSQQEDPAERRIVNYAPPTALRVNKTLDQPFLYPFFFHSP